MTPLDTNIITRKAKYIQQDLEKLGQHKNVKLAEYLKNEPIQLQVERLLEKIIGRLLDINYHLLKEKFQLTPDDYADSFTKLAQRDFISEKQASQLLKSVGLRNILAHEYDEIDPKKIHQAIKFTLTQIPPYLIRILKKITS